MCKSKGKRLHVEPAGRRQQPADSNGWVTQRIALLQVQASAAAIAELASQHGSDPKWKSPYSIEATRIGCDALLLLCQALSANMLQSSMLITAPSGLSSAHCTGVHMQLTCAGMLIRRMQGCVQLAVFICACTASVSSRRHVSSCLDCRQAGWWNRLLRSCFSHRRRYRHGFIGGKQDDVTVLVSFVEERAGQQQQQEGAEEVERAQQLELLDDPRVVDSKDSFTSASRRPRGLWGEEGKRASLGPEEQWSIPVADDAEGEMATGDDQAALRVGLSGPVQRWCCLQPAQA
jgi:hypothetical protein